MILPDMTQSWNNFERIPLKLSMYLTLAGNFQYAEMGSNDINANFIRIT